MSPRSRPTDPACRLALGRHFKACRLKRQLNRSDVQDLTGIPPETLRGMEEGRYLPGEENYRKLLDALHLIDDDLAQANVLYIRAMLPASVMDLAFITSNTPESYVRAGVHALGLPHRDYERLVAEALATLPPVDRSHDPDPPPRPRRRLPRC